jgi:BirA family biotin operon repressor/biotin-[acetyl-CoA-carboxylase] ligase
VDVRGEVPNTVRAVEFRVLHHETVDSTSECAFAALADGSGRQGDVHVARVQTRGRGRRGAAWWSSPDEGLYASVLLLPPPPTLHPAGVTVAAGLAVWDAVRALGLVRPKLKWPNDVLASGAKLAGVIAETRGLDPAAPHFVVGIGVNIAQRRFPPELERERAVTSLALEGVHASVDEVLRAVLDRLGARLEQARDDLEALADDFARAAQLHGAEVELAHGDQRTSGRLVELSFAHGATVESREGPIRVALEHIRSMRALRDDQRSSK